VEYTVLAPEIFVQGEGPNLRIYARFPGESNPETDGVIPERKGMARRLIPTARAFWHDRRVAWVGRNLGRAVKDDDAWRISLQLGKLGWGRDHARALWLLWGASVLRNDQAIQGEQRPRLAKAMEEEADRLIQPMLQNDTMPPVKIRSLAMRLSIISKNKRTGSLTSDEALTQAQQALRDIFGSLE
jgi:hypothetical protein